MHLLECWPTSNTSVQQWNHRLCTVPFKSRSRANQYLLLRPWSLPAPSSPIQTSSTPGDHECGRHSRACSLIISEFHLRPKYACFVLEAQDWRLDRPLNDRMRSHRLAQAQPSQLCCSAGTKRLLRSSGPTPDRVGGILPPESFRGSCWDAQSD